MRTAVRVGVVLVLLAALFGLFVAHGTLEPDPADNRFPGNEEIVSGSLGSGDKVVISGEIVDRDQGETVVELEVNDEFHRVVVTGFDDGEPGDDAWVYGTVAGERAVDTERSIVREPWEIVYMYAISLVAGFWVLARFLRGWRFDRDEWGFLPRDRDG